jgi:hypothetical protein
MDSKQIQQIEKRTTRYWFADGLAEMTVSFVFLVLALYFYLKLVVPVDSLLYPLLEMGFILFIVGGSFITSRIVNALKERLTYPRTGFVAYQQDRRGKSRSRIAAVFVVGVIVAAVTLLFTNNRTEFAWMPAITGLLLGLATLFFIAPRIGLVRIYLLGGAAVVVGVAISLLGFEDIPGLAWFYFLAGAGVLLSGGLTLIAYLRSNQLEGGDDDR